MTPERLAYFREFCDPTHVNSAPRGWVRDVAELVAVVDARDAEIERLRRVVVEAMGTHGDPCTYGDGCQFMIHARDALRAVPHVR